MLVAMADFDVGANYVQEESVSSGRIREKHLGQIQKTCVLQ